MDEGDILTAFIQKEKRAEEEDSVDFFVIIQRPLSKRRLFLTPGDLSKFHNLPYSQQIAVCRLVRVGQNCFVELIYQENECERKVFGAGGRNCD